MLFRSVFPVEEKDQSLMGAGFFVTEDSSSYEVFISTDYTGNLNNRRSVAKGEVRFAGYHTVEFPPEIIKAGSKFAIIVKMTGSPENYQIPLEKPVSSYSSKARAEDGQSFMGSNGQSWTDVNKIYPNTNAALKAFSVDKLYEPIIISVESIKLDKQALEMEINQEESLIATINPTNATNKNVVWISSDESIVEVNVNGKITAISPGIATITVTTEDGNKTASCEVTVKEPEPQPDPYEGYEGWKEALTTKLLNHSWIIKLSMEVDSSTENSSNVYIIDKDYNKLSFIKPQIYNDGQYGYIELKNSSEFELGKEYWIIIEDSIESIKEIGRAHV